MTVFHFASFCSIQSTLYNNLLVQVIFTSYSRRCGNFDTLPVYMLQGHKGQGCVMFDAGDDENTANLLHTMKSLSFLQEPLSLSARCNVPFSVNLWVMALIVTFQ